MNTAPPCKKLTRTATGGGLRVAFNWSVRSAEPPNSPYCAGVTGFYCRTATNPTWSRRNTPSVSSGLWRPISKASRHESGVGTGQPERAMGGSRLEAFRGGKDMTYRCARLTLACATFLVLAGKAAGGVPTSDTASIRRAYRRPWNFPGMRMTRAVTARLFAWSTVGAISSTT